ncbi:uncharacterized protein G2W53_038932 [Senna tora]|uniref:Uncharacterized protein n=1 Tax=Senna tora TaxID=362788 RepID=A0A834SP58_9FABA|nr:uncharacterized protein G2W53_038932 [Senna tora]
MAINAQRSSTPTHPRHDRVEQRPELGESDRRTAASEASTEILNTQEKSKNLKIEKKR